MYVVQLGAAPGAFTSPRRAACTLRAEATSRPWAPTALILKYSGRSMIFAALVLVSSLHATNPKPSLADGADRIVLNARGEIRVRA